MPDSNSDISLPINYAALADTARSLARTLQSAPASETPRAARFRKALHRVAATIATQLDSDEPPSESYFHALQYIQSVSIPLTSAPPIAPPNIAVVVNTFAATWLPETQLFLEASPCDDVSCLSYCLLGQDVTPFLRSDDPNAESVFMLRYPQGRQNDTMQLGPLLAENLLDILYGDDTPASMHGYPLLLAETFGPAIFFSMAEQALDYQQPDEWSDGQKFNIYCVYHALRTLGWDTHPQIGPRLDDTFSRLSQVYTWAPEPRFRVEPDFRWSPPDFSACERPLHVADLRRFTVADFDRDVPRLWERLRQLLPPNDLELDAVESTRPADPVSILNAGWSFYLLYMDDLYRVLDAQTAEDRYEAKQVLNRLLTKGIELSQIARRWKEARETS